MKAALLGKKIGMTSLFGDDGKLIPCTVIEAGPCPVVQKKDTESDGYSSVQLGFGKRPEKNTNKPLGGHFSKAGVSPTRILKEFRDFNPETGLGQNLTVEQFTVGDRVKISGKSKGKGFQGVVKRHSFKGVGMATHGQKDRQRHPGSIGQSSDPSKVFKGTRMAGRMGHTRISVRNLEILEVMPEENILIVKGSVPGARNTYLEIIKK
ncbi:50S ribosomal protein L3 [Candidatus Kapabacteria bacterium]|nr:50S ribosomal protein L3 [Candidatus Kapabacteria bacterium]